jgi:hypothetical protein
MIKNIWYSNMALSLQLNVYYNSCKLGDVLYIIKAIFIGKSENSVILLKQKEIHRSKTKMFQ